MLKTFKRKEIFKYSFLFYIIFPTFEAESINH